MTNDSTPTVDVAKRPYHTPQLEDLGSVAEQTRTGTTSDNASDGGGFPNAYVS